MRVEAVEAVIDLYKFVYKLWTDVQSLLYVYVSFGKVPKAVVDIGWKIRKSWLSAANLELQIWMVSKVYACMLAQISSYTIVHCIQPFLLHVTMEGANSYSRTSTNIIVRTEVKASKYPMIFHRIVYLPKETRTDVSKTNAGLCEDCERAPLFFWSSST